MVGLGRGSAQGLTHPLHVLASLSLVCPTHSGNKIVSDPSRALWGTSGMPHNPLPSLPSSTGPALLCFRFLPNPHIPGSLPPSASPQSPYLKLIHMSLNLWHLQGSILEWGPARRITLSSCQISVRVFRFVGPWNICSHTSLPLSHELPENKDHVC